MRVLATTRSLFNTATPLLRPLAAHRLISPPSAIRSVSTRKMSFKQDEHNLLVIPGPIEVSDDVLLANAHSSTSHMAPGFGEVVKDCIQKMRQVLYTKDGQPFLLAGSGTMGWDIVASNLVEPGEEVLLLNSGYFGDAFADCFEAKVTQLKAPIGDRPSADELEQALKNKSGSPYKLVVFTHVDTSTGVLSDAKAIGQAVRQHSPTSLVILDGVCSVASERIEFDDWNIDVVISASQKGLGCPPGLSVTVFSQKALSVVEKRQAKPTSYFCSIKRWLPIMQGYEKGAPAYFATPAVNLLYALQASLKAIVSSSPSLDERFKLHEQASKKVKAAGKELGLKELAAHPHAAANGMSAFYLPDGLELPDVVPRFLKKGVVVAAGLHKEIKTRYFRIGHMGVTVVDSSRGDIDRVIKVMSEVLSEARKEKGL